MRVIDKADITDGIFMETQRQPLSERQVIFYDFKYKGRILYVNSRDCTVNFDSMDWFHRTTVTLCVPENDNELEEAIDCFKRTLKQERLSIGITKALQYILAKYGQ